MNSREISLNNLFVDVRDFSWNIDTGVDCNSIVKVRSGVIRATDLTAVYLVVSIFAHFLPNLAISIFLRPIVLKKVKRP